MTFINAEIDLAALPAFEAVTLRPITQTYRRLLRVEWLITTLVLAIGTILLIVFFPNLKTDYKWIGLVAAYVVLMAMYYFLQEKAFFYKAFAVREHDVIYQRGWLVRKIKFCPYSRIQNCSLQSGPLERKYGLASLMLYTAGSQGADLRIPGLQKEEAEQLRHFILSRINGTNV